MTTDPAALSATELLRLYRRRQLSPVETTRAVLARIERFDPAVNAFCLVDGDRALAAARASEARWQRGEPCGLVDGVPTTIKDLVLTEGWPTLRGSLVVARDQPWAEDAPATARLREQGAVLIGKTTTPEFGWKAVTDCALTGITRNPWNTEQDAGRLERRGRRSPPPSAWAPCTSAPTAAARSGSRQASPASSA